MSISSIEHTASGWASLLQQGSTAVAASATATSSNAATAFSAALDQIKGTPAVTAASSSSSSGKSGGSSSGSSDDQKTTTFTRMAADGSMILIVMQGDTIISERKIAASNQSEAKDAKSAAIDAKLDQFNAGADVPAGTLFSAST